MGPNETPLLKENPMKKIDDALAKATSDGTINGKALAVKLGLMAAATAAGVVGTVLVQRTLDRKASDSE
jgi:hypothetical protein